MAGGWKATTVPTVSPIGNSAEGAETGDVDASDAESLTGVLEQEVVPVITHGAPTAYLANGSQ